MNTSMQLCITQQHNITWKGNRQCIDTKRALLPLEGGGGGKSQCAAKNFTHIIEDLYSHHITENCICDPVGGRAGSHISHGSIT